VHAELLLVRGFSPATVSVWLPGLDCTGIWSAVILRAPFSGLGCSLPWVQSGTTTVRDPRPPRASSTDSWSHRLAVHSVPPDYLLASAVRIRKKSCHSNVNPCHFNEKKFSLQRFYQRFYQQPPTKL